MEKYIHANGKQKKAGAATLISDKIDLKIKKIIRDKEGQYIVVKGSHLKLMEKQKAFQTSKS